MLPRVSMEVETMQAGTTALVGLLSSNLANRSRRPHAFKTSACFDSDARPPGFQTMEPTHIGRMGPYQDRCNKHHNTRHPRLEAPRRNLCQPLDQ
jgi:hypothetical protein